GLLASVQAILQQIRDRSAALTELFPEGTQLDDWKVDALREHRATLATSYRRYERGAKNEVEEIRQVLRDTLFRRDRLQAFQATLALREDRTLSRWESAKDAGLGAEHEAWYAAQADLAAGIEESPP